jgi:hypothetical protein
MECEIPPEAKAAYCVEFFVPIAIAGLFSLAISVLYTLFSRLLFSQLKVETFSTRFEDIVPKSAAVMIDDVLTNVHILPGDTCSICREGPARPVKLPCGHTGCDPCLRKWISQSDTCPFGRSLIFQSLNNATARVAERLDKLSLQAYKETLLSSTVDAALEAMSLAALQSLGIGVSPACCFGHRQANLMAAAAALTLCYALPFMIFALLCVGGKSGTRSILATAILVAICIYISVVRTGM